VHDKLTRSALFHLKSVTLDDFLAKNATTHKVNSYYTLAIFYCTFCVGNHAILDPDETRQDGRQTDLCVTVDTYSMRTQAAMDWM